MSNPNSYNSSNENKPGNGPWDEAYQQDLPPFGGENRQNTNEKFGFGKNEKFGFGNLYNSELKKYISDKVFPEQKTDQCVIYSNNEDDDSMRRGADSLRALLLIKKRAEASDDTDRVFRMMDEASQTDAGTYHEPEKFSQIVQDVGTMIDKKMDIALEEYTDDNKIDGAVEKQKTLGKALQTIIASNKKDDDGYCESLSNTARRLAVGKAAWVLKKYGDSDEFPKNIPDDEIENYVTQIAAFEEIANMSDFVADPEKYYKKLEKVELSPQDAANEYLSLLDDLSRDFTNPYYKNEGGRQHVANSKLAKQLGEKYSDNPHYRWYGYVGTEAGTDDKTLVRMAAADSIIKNEIGWRKAGDNFDDEPFELKKAEIDKKLNALETEYESRLSKKGIFNHRKQEKYEQEYNEQKKKLEIDKRNIENEKSRTTRKFNEEIANELGLSYDNSNESLSDRMKKNDSKNARFFGYDDKARAAKVERAIALRQKYESEWTKE